ncbi:heavy metal translocating P-type ATPase [Nocardia sp. IBHARD005]|uniref:heavy metal translocating P-type ATPase n=1 Tax=Nocardia sp. IBHARD005 TaxID=3457765 RepID=UPI0040593472
MTLIGTPGGLGRQRVELVVDGMTCTACAERVRRGLERLEGTRAAVNLLTGAVEVHAPISHDTATLCQAVEAAGYQAAPRLEPTPPTTGHVPGTLARHAWAAAAATAVVGVLSITPRPLPLLPATGWLWLLVAVTAATALTGAAPIHLAAWRAARRRHTTMDTLTSLGVLGTLSYSVITLLAGSAPTRGGDWPGDTGLLCATTAVTTIALAGRHLRYRAEYQAGAAMRTLAGAATRPASVLDDTGRVHPVAIEDLCEGDRLLIRAGEPVAVDGLAIDGTALLDLSALTGDPGPVPVAVGAAVEAGSVVIDGALTIEAAAVTDRARFGQLLRTTGGSPAYRGEFQRLADRIAEYITPAVLTLAGVTMTVRVAAGGSWQAAAESSLAVLLAACPCALGLATPTALLVATGRAAGLGIFFKSQRVLEQAETAASVGVVVFDKSGTLTEHGPTVAEFTIAPGTRRSEVLRLATAVEAGSRHPVAAAFTLAARAEGLGVPVACGVIEAPGLGVLGWADGHRVAVGRPRWLRRHGFTVPDQVRREHARQEQRGCTAVLVGLGDRAVASVAVAEQVRDSAAPAVAALRRLGLRPMLLTGDNRYAAQAVADRVGIDDVIAEVLPEDKAEVVRRLQDAGRRVVVVGDGVNDGPALVAADLGVTLDTGTGVAVAAADVIVTGHDLTRVPAAIGLAGATVATIRTALRWALGYNVLVVPLAVFVLDPLTAAAAMACSSIFLVSHSLRLRRYTQPTDR